MLLTERGQQSLAGVGACCEGGDSKDRYSNHRGPHDIYKGVETAADLGPVNHDSLLFALRFATVFSFGTPNVSVDNSHGGAAIRLPNLNLDGQDVHLTAVSAVGLGTHAAEHTRSAA